MAEETEGKKRGKKKKKFFLWAAILGGIAAVAAIFKRKRSQGVDEGEWQELPPAEGS